MPEACGHRAAEPRGAICGPEQRHAAARPGDPVAARRLLDHTEDGVRATRAVRRWLRVRE
ncbi:hypothetical protein [Actinoplanes philippinensis]|uniref:hypothetical protein n=1 Tax=Actinoplanes philippinensis TaxID=35752 RepID=UPI0011601B95|nr:hypothetical protein [Actinoplanes philippinensis]